MVESVYEIWYTGPYLIQSSKVGSGEYVHDDVQVYKQQWA